MILAIMTIFFPSRVTSIKSTDKMIEIVTYQKMGLLMAESREIHVRQNFALTGNFQGK